MNRTLLILASLIPALLVLAVVECFSASVGRLGQTHRLGYSFSADAEGREHAAIPDNSFAQTPRRCTRRVNLQPGGDNFPVPAALGQVQCLLPPPLPADGSWLNSGLEQSWQFHWRTALDPRAPSAVA